MNSDEKDCRKFIATAQPYNLNRKCGSGVDGLCGDAAPKNACRHNLSQQPTLGTEYLRTMLTTWNVGLENVE